MILFAGEDFVLAAKRYKVQVSDTTGMPLFMLPVTWFY